MESEGAGVRCKISVSTLLEDIATSEAKANGLDVADFMIEQLSKTKTEPVLEIQSYFFPTLQSLIVKLQLFKNLNTNLLSQIH